jgi:hypothetical protein
MGSKTLTARLWKIASRAWFMARPPLCCDYNIVMLLLQHKITETRARRAGLPPAQRLLIRYLGRTDFFQPPIPSNPDRGVRYQMKTGIAMKEIRAYSWGHFRSPEPQALAAIRVQLKFGLLNFRRPHARLRFEHQ